MKVGDTPLEPYELSKKDKIVGNVILGIYCTVLATQVGMLGHAAYTHEGPILEFDVKRHIEQPAIINGLEGTVGGQE